MFKKTCQFKWVALLHYNLNVTRVNQIYNSSICLCLSLSLTLFLCLSLVVSHVQSIILYLFLSVPFFLFLSVFCFLFFLLLINYSVPHHILKANFARVFPRARPGSLSWPVNCVPLSTWREFVAALPGPSKTGGTTTK